MAGARDPGEQRRRHVDYGMGKYETDHALCGRWGGQHNDPVGASGARHSMRRAEDERDAGAHKRLRPQLVPAVSIAKCDS